MFILLLLSLPLTALCLYLAAFFWHHRLRRKALFLALTAVLLLGMTLAIGLISVVGYSLLQAELQ